MKLKLQNEIELTAGKKALEILKLNTEVFPGWNKNEISALSDYMRFLTYQKSTFLATKGEEVDYFGILISGRALIQVDSKVYGYLETGDMVGYMGMTKMPGSEVHHFDIVGEKNGIIAAIRVEDLKILLKREPLVGFKLTQLMTKKCYEIVQAQYKPQPIKSKKQQKLEPSQMPLKRVGDLFENSPEFAYFINVIEKRDKKYLLSNCQLFEFQSEQQIVLEGDKNCIIFVLKGELISFSKGKQPHIYKSGSIVGRKEFFQDSFFKENIYGRFSGIFLRLTKEILTDISLQNAQSACNLISLIVRCDCLDVKKEYENEHEEFNAFKKKYRSQEEEKKEKDDMMQRLKQDAIDKEKQLKEQKQDRINQKKKENGTFSELDRQKELKDKQELQQQQTQQSKRKKRPEDIDDIFIEIDVNKKITLQSNEKQDKMLEEFKEYQRNFEIAPLYVHDIYSDQIENEEENQNSKPKKNIRSDGISTFYQEKITSQQLEKQAFIQELKQLKRKKLITEEEYQQKLKNKSAPAVEDDVDDYEELKNELTIIQGEKRQLQEQLDELKEENLQIRQTLREKQSDMQMIQAKVNKSNLQRELLGKGLKDISEQNNGESFLALNKRAQQSKDKFNDVLDEQLQYNKRIQLITKCARKWLKATKESIRMKKTQGRFGLTHSQANFSQSAYY